MGIQNWSEDIILVDLPQEPNMGDELKTVTDMARDRGDCDVVIDFSDVDIVTSSSLSKLLKLRKLLDSAPKSLWAGFQIFYPMSETEVRGSTGLDLVESMLAVFREVTPAMNQCMQIELTEQSDKILP